MDLKEFLHLPHEFKFGGWMGEDCTTFCASWARECTGIDPAAPFRRTYSTLKSANALLASHGGIVSFYDERLTDIGYLRTDCPQDGDIGVVVAPSGIDRMIKHVGGIRFGPLWAVMAQRGVIAKKLDHVAAWTLRHHAHL
ncbi:MAG: hypothetical protein J0H18_18525 [Rhizobiales bacterium]|nr:hypothetical protein [Hyphomicrobiales bacterium]OJX99104.1 MAG: hypothetical protein BGP07_03340 [Rhizobiales bacterium 63-22]